MHRALELPGNVDLSDFSWFLHRRGIPHRITEESGKQVLWTISAEESDIIVNLYQQWSAGTLDLPTAPPRRGLDPGGMLRHIPWRQMPVTTLSIFACLLVALITRGGDDWQTTAWFSFVPFEVVDGYIYFGNFTLGMEHGQYWRVLSPVLLHFGLSHLAFNMLGLYIFGGRLEQYQGSWNLLVIILFTAVVSNLSQYFWGGNVAIFGGFSGVVYGLMGYCMVREKVDRHWQFGLPSIYYGVMLAWLVIGFTGVLGSIGFGNMANAAHVGGLLAGALLGAVAGLSGRKDHAA